MVIILITTVGIVTPRYPLVSTGGDKRSVKTLTASGDIGPD
jgi:hypothetical protein